MQEFHLFYNERVVQVAGSAQTNTLAKLIKASIESDPLFLDGEEASDFMAYPKGMPHIPANLIPLSSNVDFLVRNRLGLSADAPLILELGNTSASAAQAVSARNWIPYLKVLNFLLSFFGLVLTIAGENISFGGKPIIANLSSFFSAAIGLFVFYSAVQHKLQWRKDFLFEIVIMYLLLFAVLLMMIFAFILRINHDAKNLFTLGITSNVSSLVVGIGPFFIEPVLIKQKTSFVLLLNLFSLMFLAAGYHFNDTDFCVKISQVLSSVSSLYLPSIDAVAWIKNKFKH